MLFFSEVAKDTRKKKTVIPKHDKVREQHAHAHTHSHQNSSTTQHCENDAELLSPQRVPLVKLLDTNVFALPQNVPK